MRILLTALMALTMLTACNKTDTNTTNLHLTGNIKGLKQGKIYIKKVSDTAFVAIDTIIINGSSDFESTIQLESPEMLYLFLDRGQTNSVDNTLPFFAEPGEMRIESNNELFFSRAKVAGSQNHKLYEDFLKIKSRYTNQRLDLVEKNMQGTKTGNAQHTDSINGQINNITKRRYLATANFALNNTKHEVAPFIALSEISDIGNISLLDTISKSMTPEIAKSHYGKMLIKHIAFRKAKENQQ